MNVSIELPANIEQALRRRAMAIGQDITTFVVNIVTEELADDASLLERSNSHAEFMAKLQEIVQSHPASKGNVDDSRESIYAGCGE